MHPAVDVQSLNHWTTRQVSDFFLNAKPEISQRVSVINSKLETAAFPGGLLLVSVASLPLSLTSYTWGLSPLFPTIQPLMPHRGVEELPWGAARVISEVSFQEPPLPPPHSPTPPLPL